MKVEKIDFRGYLVDTTKCIGCRGCVVACKNWNQLSAESSQFKGSYQTVKDFSANNFTYIGFNEYEENGQLKWFFTKRHCMHCTATPNGIRMFMGISPQRQG